MIRHRLQKVHRIIKSLMEIIIRQFADILVGLHPVYLSRIYKEITGTLPGKYIMMQRVNESLGRLFKSACRRMDAHTR